MLEPVECPLKSNTTILECPLGHPPDRRTERERELHFGVSPFGHTHIYAHTNTHPTKLLRFSPWGFPLDTAPQAGSGDLGSPHLAQQDPACEVRLRCGLALPCPAAEMSQRWVLGPQYPPSTNTATERGSLQKEINLPVTSPQVSFFKRLLFC